MHGSALLGLCAPLTVIKNADKVYIAATNSIYFTEPLGSLPEIDNHIAWSNVKCIHDGYQYSRQEKIEKIAQYYRQTGNSLPLKVCLERKGYNCSSGYCRKCAFTITGLKLAGLNPNEHGFKINENIYSEIKDNITKKDAFSNFRRYVWRDLQKHARKSKATLDSDASDFFRWLRNANVEEFGLRISKQHLLWETFSPMLKYVPYRARALIGKAFENLQKNPRLKNIIKL